MFTDVSLSEVKFYWCADHWSKSLTNAIIYHGKCSVDQYGKNNFLLGNKCIINLLTYENLVIKEEREFYNLKAQKKFWALNLQDPVVLKVDNAIHWISIYPVDSAIGFPNTYSLDLVI